MCGVIVGQWHSEPLAGYSSGEPVEGAFKAVVALWCKFCPVESSRYSLSLEEAKSCLESSL